MILKNIKLKILYILFIIINRILLEKIKKLENENKKNIALIQFQKGYIDGMKSK